MQNQLILQKKLAREEAYINACEFGRLFPQAMNPFLKGEYCNITVRNARTHIEEGRAKFTDYEIEVKTNHISFAVKQSKVRRRYSDFVWLRDRLAKDLMTSEAPSLPGRRLFGRFNTDFIKQRQRKLQDFLTKVIKNNVFLSNAALHLFLQTKMSIEEIEEQMESKNDEDASDRILSESAFKEPTEQRDRLPSKHDSGIESCGHDDADVGDLSTLVSDTCGEEAEKLADGNTADSEDNAEFENEASDNNNTDEDQLEEKFRRKLHLSSLSSATAKEEENELESSVEFSLGRTSDSEPNDDVIDEDEEAEANIAECRVRKCSTGSFKKPRRRRSKRRRRTCIPQFNLSGERHGKDEELQSSNPGLFDKAVFVRRCISFDMFSRSFSMFDMKKHASSSSSRNIDCDSQSFRTSRSSLCKSSSSKFLESEERYRLKCSGSEERFRSPVKRRISLKEYHIVRRDACFHDSMDEKDFNTSF